MGVSIARRQFCIFYVDKSHAKIYNCNTAFSLESAASSDISLSQEMLKHHFKHLFILNIS
jgi:hypothetical protein